MNRSDFRCHTYTCMDLTSHPPASPDLPHTQYCECYFSIFLRNQHTAQNLSSLAYWRSEESFHVHCICGTHVHRLWWPTGSRSAPGLSHQPWASEWQLQIRIAFSPQISDKSYHYLMNELKNLMLCPSAQNQYFWKKCSEGIKPCRYIEPHLLGKLSACLFTVDYLTNHGKGLSSPNKYRFVSNPSPKEGQEGNWDWCQDRGYTTWCSWAYIMHDKRLEDAHGPFSL